MNPAHPTRRADLEAVVRRLVVEALRSSASDNGGAPAGAAAQPTEPATHSLSDAVISLGVLETLPEGVRQVQITPRAVLTPAAADLLREQQIRVLRGSFADSPSPGSPSPGPDAAALRWIADADFPDRTAAYLRQLAQRGLTTTAAQLPLPPKQLPAGSVGVVIAEVPALHVDQFARVASLPAAAVGSLSDVGKIAAVMTPVVWVLDGDRLSFSGRIAVAIECFRISRFASRTSSAASVSAHTRRPR